MKVCPSCDACFDGPDWSCGCGWRAARKGAIALIAETPGAEGFEAEFFERLARVEGRHFWFRARNAILGWALARYFPDARSFLDAGCGTGQVTRALQPRFPSLQFTACEAFTEGLERAGGLAAGTELVCADIRQLPWQNEFDVVGAFDVLEHVAEDVDAMRRMARAARPGGGVLITVPQHPWLWSPIDDYSGHQRRYTRAGLVSRLREAGLDVEHVTSFMTLLLPVMMLSRFSRRDAAPDPDAETRISAFTNAVGAALTGVERVVLRTGLSLPAGGSLLVVARKAPSA